jgi:hypothetical protein
MASSQHYMEKIVDYLAEKLKREPDQHERIEPIKKFVSILLQRFFAALIAKGDQHSHARTEKRGLNLSRVAAFILHSETLTKLCLLLRTLRWSDCSGAQGAKVLSAASTHHPDRLCSSDFVTGR